MSDYQEPNRLGVRNRTRTLTVTSLTDDQQSAMKSSIDNLQNDLSLVSTQWHNILDKDSNPLETALAFLDDTSVGLGYRYNEFNQLEHTLGDHLQDVVNEHCQAFNANVASYTKTVSALTDAQSRTSSVKKDFKTVTDLITKEKGELDELDSKCLQYSNMITSLSQIEELMQIPEAIEDNIRKDQFKNVQNLIQKGFSMLNSPNLKHVSQLAPIRQQIELQEHILFENIIQEIHNVIYSKNGLSKMDSDILRTISISQNGFTSLENYLFNIANIDIVKQSKLLNGRLDKFINLLHDNNGFQDTELIKDSQMEQSEYYKIFNLMSLLKGTTRLPSALTILTERANEEIHNIIIKCTEQVRLKNPTLLKMVNKSITEETFGPSVKQLFSLIMRECFWEIFLKLLVAVQGHRLIFEISSILQNSPTSHNSYRFDKVWKKLLNEVESLLRRYLINPNLMTSDNNVNSNDPEVAAPQRKRLDKIFSLQDNIEDIDESKKQAGDLKALLKDIFLGFTMDSNVDLNNIYLEDETFEQEESLIPPSVFNMKVILEPFLLFSQASSSLIPPVLIKDSISSMTFFNKIMENTFANKLRDTLDHLFISKIESNNKSAVETIEGDTKTILKSAVDFQTLFYNQIQLLNTSNMFRPQMIELLLDTLTKFSHYINNIFELILAGTDKNLGKNILREWSNDENLMELEKTIIQGKNTELFTLEADTLYQHCKGFYSHNNNTTDTSNHLSSVMFESLVYLSATLMWINDWLPHLKRNIDSDANDQLSKESSNLDADELRQKWSFFEYADITHLESSKSGSSNKNHRKNPNLSILLSGDSLHKFNNIIHGFQDLYLQTLSLMRFDIRSRCIFKIGSLFIGSRDWKLEVGAGEIDSNISSLISDLRIIEDKLNKQRMEREKDIVFTGIDMVNDMSFIKGSRAISVLNSNGIKKLERNINVLQHGIRNMYHESGNVTTLSNALSFYALVGGNEKILIEKLEAGELFMFSEDDLKTVLRLQFSEEFAKQNKRASAMAGKSVSMAKPLNRRYDTALKTIESLLK